MKIYIERKINTEADLPRKEGWYIVKCADNENPEYMKIAAKGNVFWSKVAYWLEPIEISDGAEEIMREKLDYLKIIDEIDDSRYTTLHGCYDVRIGTRIMYDHMWGRILKVMQQFAAQEVAKALQMLACDNEDDDKIDLSQPDDLSFLQKPTDEEIIKQAKENYQYKDSDDYGEDVIHAKRIAYFEGAKAALNGEIKKKDI